MHGQQPTSLSRRNFLRGALIGGGALVGAVGVLGFGRMLFSGSGGRPKIGVVTVSQSELPEVGAPPLTHDDGGFHLVNTEDGALALSWVCTHQGCKVPWNDDDREFHCPCHGARYDLSGTVTGGPAPRPLDLLPLTFDATGNAQVNTDKVVKRDAYEPAQAVPVREG
jgi:cytochrome b6-f complex iron-sulfur subunit